MDIKHCEHCEQIYSAPKEGGASVLCRKCLMDCEAAYLKVRRYITENRNATLEEAAAATEVPEIFVQAMVLDGRFEISHELRMDGEDSEELRRRKQMLDDINEARGQLNSPPPGGPELPPPPSSKGKRYGLGR